MTKFRKFLISILLVFASITPLWSTGYPVIDISAIMNAIAEFSTTVQHYSQTIQKYKSEYDRLVKAAKTMAKGDFNSIMDGLAQSMTAISGYGADFEWAAEVSAAIKTGQKLTKDAQQMANSVESAWAGFLQQMENAASGSPEETIDFMWDFFSASPLAETMAATDRLTGDFLNDAYIKKLKGNEWREKVLADHEEEIQQMSNELAASIKAKTTVQSNLETMRKNLETAKQKTTDAYNAWMDAQTEVNRIAGEIQTSIGSDGDTESAATKQLREALARATSRAESAHANYQEALRRENQMQSDYDATHKTYLLADSEFSKKKEALENYVKELERQSDTMEATEKKVDKMEQAYYQVQTQRFENYVEAHTYTPLPSEIPSEANTASKIRYYIKYGTLNGYSGD